MYLLEKMKRKIQKAAIYAEEVQWQMKLERLTNLCGDTGGESSPYFEHLRKHLETDPKRKDK